MPDLPRYLHFAIESQELYATLNTGFVRVSNESVEYIVAKASADRGSAIGSLAESQVNAANAFIKLIDGVWLLTDWNNDR